MKILVISLAGIGDTLFATPLIHELRANFPDATIDALVLWQGAKDLLEGNPHLNTVHQKNLLKASKVDAVRFLLELRKNQYDFSINTHPQSRIHYRMVARFINAPVRISHTYDNASMLDRWLVNRTLPQDYERHAIDNNLALLTFLGAKPRLTERAYEIYFTEAEFAWAGEFLRTHRLAGRTILGIHIGSGGTKNLALRRWPLESYLALIQELSRKRPELAVLLFGGPEEERDHQAILAQTNHDSVFHPKTRNLRQVAALLKSCDAFLSVDTALMHLAAAMRVPKQIVIETPTWNKPIEPYNQPIVLVKNPSLRGNNLSYYRYDGRGIQGTAEELTRSMESVSVESVLRVV